MATNTQFNYHPLTTYSLDDGATNQVVVDIFKRIIFSKEYLDNSSYYQKYDLRQGDSPEDISFRFYGTPNLHWLVLMVNNIVDPRFEWPLTEEELYEQTKSKYGVAQNVYATNRAKNKKGYVVETFFILTEESTHEEPQRLLFETNDSESINQAVAYQDSTEIDQFESNFEVETERNEINRSIRILRPEIVKNILNSYSSLINQ